MGAAGIINDAIASTRDDVPFFYRDRHPQGCKAVSIEECSVRVVRRWLCRVEPPVRFTRSLDSAYHEGDETTEYVVVSWGRDGDTGVFPSDADGRILDMLGFGTTFTGHYLDPEDMLGRCGFEVA